MGRLWAGMALAWLAAWVCVGVGGLDVRDGRYHDLVIALDPQMRMDIIDHSFTSNVKDLLANVNTALSKSTRGRLSMGSAKVVLPHWWNNTKDWPLGEPQQHLTWHSADIRLVEPQRKTQPPYTVEEKYGPQGYVFMHEWAHYRWGVWEEYGYPGDSVYPVRYSTANGETLPTACHHGHLHGEFKTKKGENCKDDNSQCYFFPDENNNASSTKSSLMSLTYLSDGNFCDSETHDPWAPTPQNLQCGRRSVWEMLNKHPDFRSTNDPVDSIGSTTFHKAPQARVFFLFDTPNTDEDVTYVTKLVNDILTKNLDFYGSLQVGMATFREKNGETELIKHMNFTSIEDISDIAEKLPETSDRLNEGTTPVGEAVREVVEGWETYYPGTLVVTVSWNLVSQDQADLLDKLTLIEKRVKLLVLSPGSKGLANMLPLAPLLQYTGGHFYAKEERQQAASALSDDMDTYLQAHTVDDHKLYGVSSTNVTAGKKTTLPLVIIDNDKVKQINAYIKLTPFNSSNIEVYYLHPVLYYDVSCDDPKYPDLIHCETSDTGVFVYIPVSSVANNQAEYRVSVENVGEEDALAEVTWSLVDKDASNQQVVVDVWSSEDQGVKADIPESNNLFLYCQVSHSRGGVIEGTTVQAEVTLDDGSGSPVVRVLTMVDDGRGDVDVRRRDNIWSAEVKGTWAPNTILTVNRLAINHDPDFSPFSTKPQLVSSPSGGERWEKEEEKMKGYSGVLPRDPTEGYCCGSYSDGNKLSAVVNVFLMLPFTITLTNGV
ncbi:Calcium-activated chloride channel regulator 4A-like 1, partial [Homarus americanus]